MKILIAIAIAMTTFGTVSTSSISPQACDPSSNCTPPDDINNWDNTGKARILIHVDGSVINNPDALAEAQEGVDNWNACPQQGEGRTPRLTLNTVDGAGDVDLIIAWPARAEAACGGCAGAFVKPGGGVSRWTIYIKPGWEDDPNLYDHEFSHVLDMASIWTSGCEHSIFDTHHYNGTEINPCDCMNADIFNETRYEQGHTPLVLDVNGDRHIPTTSVDADPATFFDLDADGQLDRVGWLAQPSEDAFLWLDRDANAVVTNGGELFGSATAMASGELAENGWEALASYDLPEFGGNQDGMITPEDQIWASLRLWFDADQNGESGVAEISTLDDQEITGLGLRHANNHQVDTQGNLHIFRGTFWERRPGPGRGTQPGLIEDIRFRSR